MEFYPASPGSHRHTGLGGDCCQVRGHLPAKVLSAEAFGLRTAGSGDCGASQVRKRVARLPTVGSPNNSPLRRYNRIQCPAAAKGNHGAAATHRLHGRNPKILQPGNRRHGSHAAALAHSRAAADPENTHWHRPVPREAMRGRCRQQAAFPAAGGGRPRLLGRCACRGMRRLTTR